VRAARPSLFCFAAWQVPISLPPMSVPRGLLALLVIGWGFFPPNFYSKDSNRPLLPGYSPAPFLCSFPNRLRASLTPWPAYQGAGREFEEVRLPLPIFYLPPHNAVGLSSTSRPGYSRDPGLQFFRELNFPPLSLKSSLSFLRCLICSTRFPGVSLENTAECRGRIVRFSVDTQPL